MRLSVVVVVVVEPCALGRNLLRWDYLFLLLLLLNPVYLAWTFSSKIVVVVIVLLVELCVLGMDLER